MSSHVNFSAALMDEGRKLFAQGAIQLPLSRANKRQISATCKVPFEPEYRCTFLLSESMTTLAKFSCTCDPLADQQIRPDSSAPCKHVMALVFAYEHDRASVQQVGPKSPGEKSTAVLTSKTSPPLPNSSAHRRSKLSKGNKSPFDHPIPSKGQEINAIRAKVEGKNITQISLDDQTRAKLENLAHAVTDWQSITISKDLPEFAYLLVDTAYGAFPRLDIINMNDNVPPADRVVSHNSELWSKASIDQRHANTLRKMVAAASDEYMDCLDYFMYSEIWAFLIKWCISTSKCYYQSLESAPLELGLDSNVVSFSWITLNNQIVPEFLTAEGAKLLPWRFPFYLNGQTLGKALPYSYFRWYHAIWDKTDAPPDAYNVIEELINAFLAKRSIENEPGYPKYLDSLRFFPTLQKSIVDSESVFSRSGIENLRFTIGIDKQVPEIPLVRAWEPSPQKNGETKFVPVTWSRVRKEGSWKQAFIAASWQKFRRYTTPKLIEETAVSVELWSEFLDFIITEAPCYWEAPDNGEPLQKGLLMNGNLHWKVEGDNYVCKLGGSGDPSAIWIPWFIPMYINQRKNTIGRIVEFPPGPLLKALWNMPPLPLSMITAAMTLIHALNIKQFFGELLQGMKFHATKPATTLGIRTTEVQRNLIISFAAVDERATLHGNVLHITTKDTGWIFQCEARMKELGFECSEPFNSLDSEYKLIARTEESWRTLYAKIRQLKKEGFLIASATESKLSPQEISEKNFAFNLSDSKPGWFSLSIAIIIGDEKINLLPVLLSAIRPLADLTENSIDSLNERGKFVAVLEDGRMVSMPFDRIQIILLSLRELFLDLKKPDRDGRQRGSKSSVPQPSDSLDVPGAQAKSLLENEKFANSEKSASDSARKALEQSRLLNAHEELDPPPGFRATLRPYQKEGLRWLDEIAAAQTGGILADEMGLGKTVQVIAKLVLDKWRSPDTPLGVLIICPASLVGNWQNELKKFAPELKVMQYTGEGRYKLTPYMNYDDIILTTYNTFLRDMDWHRRRQEKSILAEQEQPILFTDVLWNGVYLDEAQTIKNKDAKITAAIKELTAVYRICMTGTPVENHLGELWSLTSFTNPDLFPEWKSFNTLIRKPIEEGDRIQAAILRHTMAPYMLRRLKEDVLTDLPPKIESYMRVELTDMQAGLYEAVRLMINKELKAAMAEKGVLTNHIEALQILLRLRQVCLHSDLCKLDAAREIHESAKLETLVEKLEDLLIRDRKILIFSQFVEMLTIIGAKLEDLGIPFVKLTGDDSLDARTKTVKDFQETDVQILLISLHAGGAGLNLQRADTIILYDPWWNPAKENQAIGRAHRMGQTDHVFVFRMIASGTIEEQILQLKAKKGAIADALFNCEMSDEEILKRLTMDDLMELIGPISNADSEL